METIWSGGITSTDGSLWDGITLSASQHEAPTGLEGAGLRFLAVVETARIPLHMTVGAPYHVATTHRQTESCFTDILLGGDDSTTWWQASRTDSPLAILVAVDWHASAKAAVQRPKVTELLFYASSAIPPIPCQRPPTPPLSSPLPAEAGPDLDIKVFALPLSSELLHSSREPTPPASPSTEVIDTEALFLPTTLAQSFLTKDEVVHELQPRKRRTANDAFDEAAERRRKARRKGGEGVAAAAASQVKVGTALPPLKHRRTVSNTQPLQNRPLSRASSVSSIRQSTAREPSLPPTSKSSGLSKSQSASTLYNLPEQPSTEQKNKEYVSKMVMSGMRLHGLVQRKGRKSRANSPNIDDSLDEMEKNRRNDEEYKLVYHQVYKGTCFAFRQYLAGTGLQSHALALQETVEKLLAIFLSDPLTTISPEGDDEFTPGGRNQFGSSALRASVPTNPFVQSERGGGMSSTNTPCTKRGAKTAS